MNPLFLWPMGLGTAIAAGLYFAAAELFLRRGGDKPTGQGPPGPGPSASAERLPDEALAAALRRYFGEAAPIQLGLVSRSGPRYPSSPPSPSCSSSHPAAAVSLDGEVNSPNSEESKENNYVDDDDVHHVRTGLEEEENNDSSNGSHCSNNNGYDFPSSGWDDEGEQQQQQPRRLRRRRPERVEEKFGVSPAAEDTEANVVIGKKKVEGNGQSCTYPQRPNEPVCTYYLSTGKCGFGKNCKFNHPPGRGKRNRAKSSGSSEPTQAKKEKEKGAHTKGSGKSHCKEMKRKEKEEHPERAGWQPQCKFYLAPGGCKFGKACKYSHCQVKSEAGQVELNFLDLPVRPGEKECSFYMRTGFCKFGTNCRFHHPDPTAANTCDLVSGYHISGSSQPYDPEASQQPVSWPLPSCFDVQVPFVDTSSSFDPLMLFAQQSPSSMKFRT